MRCVHANHTNMGRKSKMIKSYTWNALLAVASISACATPDSKAPEPAPDNGIRASTCTVDLVKGVSDCDGMDGVTVRLAQRGLANATAGCMQARTDIDLSPGGKRARFAITYGASISGWTVNIGDSPTNNGGGGDAGTQSRDAEMQILDTTMSVLGNDHTVGSKLLASVGNLGLANRTIGLLVGDLRLDWSNLSPSPNGFVSSPYLYALAGQSDTQGPVNYTIHAGFNRVVDDGSAASRSGCGVTSFSITVETSCGDGVCSGTETCSSCSADCGSCPPPCGDGVCSSTETCSSCSADCGSCQPCCPPGSTCLAGDTRITLADGSSKAIADVVVGDRVLSYDPVTRSFTAGAVTKTFRHPNAEDTVVVNGSLRATPNHPFFVDGVWKRADELAVGDTLLRLDAGDRGALPMMVAPGRVESLQTVPGRLTTYNLEVAGAHDYFANDLLVHNKTCQVCDPL